MRFFFFALDLSHFFYLMSFFLKEFAGRLLFTSICFLIISPAVLMVTVVFDLARVIFSYAFGICVCLSQKADFFEFWKVQLICLPA